jgi:hypothetical protein
MPSEKNKHLLIVASGGRTGTRFFGETLGLIVEDCVSFHEADVLTTDLRASWRKVREFGIYRNFVGKLLDQTGLRAIGLKRLAGRLTADEAATEVRRHRSDFYARQSRSLIVDSSLQWFALLDALPFTDWPYRAICVIRDPRAWVASAEKWGHWWASSSDWVRRLGRLRLTPCLVDDQENCHRWRTMPEFERLCWSWTALNRVMLDAAKRDPRIRIFRFEDLFFSSDRRTHMEEMLEFGTGFRQRSFAFDASRLLKMAPVNTSGGRSQTEWLRWGADRCQVLGQHCGKLMQELGYGLEPEWCDRISQRTLTPGHRHD